LESEYAHGNRDAYPLTLYGMLKLYRKEYMPQPKKKNNVPNNNNGNDDDDKEKEDKKEEEEKPEDDAINAHMDAGSDDDDAKAEAFLAAHVDDDDSVQVGWVNDSLDDQDYGDIDPVCALFPYEGDDEEVIGVENYGILENQDQNSNQVAAAGMDTELLRQRGLDRLGAEGAPPGLPLPEPDFRRGSA